MNNLSLKQREQLGVEYIPYDKGYIYVPILNKSILQEDIPSPPKVRKKTLQFSKNYTAGSNIPAVASKMPAVKPNHGSFK